MAEIISDKYDIDFVLYEQLGILDILNSDTFRDFDKKTCDMIIKEARTFAIKEILPTYSEADRQGVKFEKGNVFVPECFRNVHKLLVEGEWAALTENPEYGGQGIPHTIAQAAMEYMIGANYSLMTYAILGHSAGKMVDIFGTPEQKRLFLKKMYTCEWGSTMLLTEPEAGSDLGALTTCAEKNSDGTYSITGNKIFITNGEQNLTENIIHPVLARIKGAPAGTKGISIFLVPKIWVNEDGSLGERNDIVCTGIEEKMGLHGSPTCSMSLGSKGKCRGLLLGKENQGMAIMFHMMNEVRLEVGTQAFTHASCSYLSALDYASKRLQGRAIENINDHGAPQVPIIRHPDVQRMLLKMKSFVEGMRSLTFFTAFCFDKMKCAATTEEKEHYKGLTEILTPVVKAYCSERGFDVCVMGMQIFGGYGYTKEYPMEQFVRDCKICSIYEGSNGIQAIDFFGRKLVMKQNRLLKSLISEIKKTIEKVRTDTCAQKGKQNRVHSEIKINFHEMAEKVELAADKFYEASITAVNLMESHQIKLAFSFAHPLMEIAGDIIMAWMLLWRASVAASLMDKIVRNSSAPIKSIIQKNKKAAFYYGKIMAADFFISNILPVTMGKINVISSLPSSPVDIYERSF